MTGACNIAAIDRFRAAIGDKFVLVAPEDVSPFLSDPRGIFPGQAAAVLKPGSTKEVSEILKLAQETQTPVVTQGGNTGLVGGQTSLSEQGVILSTVRLNQIREIDASGNTMTCEAGVLLARAQAAAAEKQRLFPLSLGAEGSCTVGGNLATNAGGTNALAYGVARDLVLGVEVVLADGRIWNGLKTIKKDNSGYDLRNLFIGSEGTLGIVTAAVLKLFARQQGVTAIFAGIDSPASGLELLNIFQQRFSSALVTFELIGREAVGLVLEYFPKTQNPLQAEHAWYALIEVSFSGPLAAASCVEDALSAAFDNGIIENATIAQSELQRRAFWKIREGIVEAQQRAGLSIKHDISVPIASIPDFIKEADKAVREVLGDARMICFGHFGDGNLHYNVSQPRRIAESKFSAIEEEISGAVYDLTIRFKGSIAAEHGIGILKREKLAAVKDRVEIELMQTIKRSLDPKNILNPGKVLAMN